MPEATAHPVLGRLMTASMLLFALVALAGCSAAPPDRAGGPVVAEPADTLQLSRDRGVASVLERIEGREDEPAGEVFENVKLLKGVPAGRLLRIMDVGFGRSLGVTCDHCHERGEWASDEKRPKRAAREMWRLVGRINRELLPAIDALDSERPTVNCTTCHRGDVVPATSLP